MERGERHTLVKNNRSRRISKLVSLLNSFLLVTILSIFQIANISPANAVACSTSAAAQNSIKVTPSHGAAFYIDSGVTPKLDAGYVGYIVTNTSASAVKGYWVELTSFTGGVISLANPDDKYMELDNMGASGSGSESATAYILLKATNATTSAQTHTVKVWNKRPDLNGASTLYSCTYTFSAVKETIKAASNKVVDNGNRSGSFGTTSAAIEVSDTTPELGQNITITVEGETGNIGQGSTPDNDVIWLTPAAISSWPTRSLKLVDVSITFEGDNNWSNSSNRKTYTDRLLITSANGLTDVDQSLYVATYTFRVIGNPGSSVKAVPVAQISSGTQMKHTDTNGSGATATLSFSTVVINYNLAKTVTSNSNLETTTVSGTTYLKVPYQLKITSTSSTQTTVDEIVDVPPSSTSFSTGSARLTDVNNSNVTLSDPTYISSESSLNPRPMHFVGPFTVSSSTPITLTYTMLLPNISTTYTNQAYAIVGDLKVGATASTIPQVTVTSTSGSTTVTSETANVTSAVEAITNAASDVDTKTATMNATIDPNGNGGTAIFQYGTSPSLASFTEVTATTPSSGTLTGSTPLASSYTFSGTLSANTTYYFRIRVGTVYGDILSFTTAGIASNPTSTTLAASSVGTTTATLNGTINPNFTPIVMISFEYGTNSSLSSGTTTGKVYESDGTTLSTASGGTEQSFSLAVTGLSNGTTYYFRISACKTLSGANCSAGANYDGSILSFTTGRSNQTITFDAISDKTYGDSTFSVSDTSTSGLSITNTSLTTSVCTISGNTVTIVAVGTCTIRATQTGNGSYNPAPAVEQSFYINPKTITITADDKSKTYGAATPSMSNSITGFVGSDLATISAINRTYIGSSVAYSESSTAPSDAGTYKIVVNTATLSFSSGVATNYQITYVDGTYTINVRTLTITANDKSKTAGAANPTFNVTLSGLQGSDTATVSAMTYTFQGTGSTSYAASTDTPTSAGTYSNTPSAGSLTFSVGSSSNYSYAYVAGTYTINTPGKSADSIAMNDASVVYGETLNVVTLLTSSGSGSGLITYSINSGTGCSISGTTLTANKGSGTCDVLASKAGDATYDPATDIATITFTKRPITIKSSDTSKTYGASDPSLNSYSVTSGSVYSSDTFTVTGSRTSGESAGTYTITPSISSSTPSTFSDSYTVVYDTGIFTINQASQTITLTDATVTYGNTLTLSTILTDGSGTGSVSYSSSGSGCSISAGVLTALKASGTCTVTANKAADTNYSSASDPATITLGKRSITITASSVSKVAGAGDPSLLGYSITSGSLANSDTFTVNASRTSGETAGTYAITQTIATSTPSPLTDSYTVTLSPGTLTITGGTSQTITFTMSGPKTYGSTFTIGATSTSGLAVTLTPSGGGCTGSGTTTLASDSIVVTAAAAGSNNCVYTASQAGDGTYAAATDVVQTISISTVTLTITAANKSINEGDSAPTFTSSVSGFIGSDSATVTSATYTFTGTGGTSYSSSTSVPSGAGTYSNAPSGATLSFSSGSSANYTLSYANGTYTITALSSQTIAIDDSTLTYNTTLTLSLSNAGSGSGSVTYTLTSGSGCSLSSTTLTALSGTGTCVVTADKAAGGGYAAASDTATITLAKATQTITFTQPSSLANGSSQTLSYSASSGLTVTITNNSSSKCSVSGTSVTGNSVGTCDLTASQAGNSNYSAATDVNRTFEITAPGRSLRSQSINLSGGTLPYLTTVSMSGTGYSGTGSITFSLNSGNCSLSGNQITAQGSSGSCIVTVNIASDSTYNSASNNATFNLVRANQVINFTQPQNMLVGESRQSLTYSASSGLPVSLSNNSSGICSVYTSGTDPERNGTCSITATQGGNANYNPATSVTVTYSITSVVKKQQNLVFNQPSAMLTSDPGQKLYYFSMTTVPINVTVNSPSICTVRDGNVYPVSAGQCSITVYQNGTVEYDPASITRIFNIVSNQSVAKRQYSLTWSNPSPIYEGTPLTSIQLNAEASISGTYEYTPTFGVKLPRGTYKLLVLFTPSDIGTYTSLTATVTLLVRAGAEPTPTPASTVRPSASPSSSINPQGNGVVTVATTPVTTVITQVTTSAVVSVPTPSSMPTVSATPTPSSSPSPSRLPTPASTNSPNPNSSKNPTPNSSQAATPTPAVNRPSPGVTSMSIPTPSVASATPKPSSTTTVINQGVGIDVVTTSGKEVTVVAEEGYSGKTTVTVNVQDSGQSKKVVIPVTVLPLPAKDPTYQLLSLSKTIVHWGQSDNANSYQVVIDGKKVCATEDLSCTLNKAYGQNNKVEVVALGQDNLSSKAPALFDKSQPFLLTVVNFDTAKYSLTSTAQNILKDVANKVKVLGYKNFTIYGFTDIRGGIDNQKLSYDRATSVKIYISKLVAGANFEIGFYGPNYPVASNSTVEGLAANRRAEIWVTG